MNVKPEQKHNSDKMPIAETSSHNSSKPHVGSSAVGYASDEFGESWTVNCPNCDKEFEYTGWFDSGDKTVCKCGCTFKTKYLELENGNIIK